MVTDNVVTGGYILRKGTGGSRVPWSRSTTRHQDHHPEHERSGQCQRGRSQSRRIRRPEGRHDDRERPDLRQERFGQRDGRPLSSAGSTGEFVDNYELSFFDNLVSMAEGNLENYSAIQIADISANSQARGSDKSVRLTFSAPGVKTGSARHGGPHPGRFDGICQLQRRQWHHLL